MRGMKIKLTPQNSTNPRFWGKELVYDIFPKEFDFLKYFTGASWAIAKYYYEM